MTINDLVKDAHEAAVKKGFYQESVNVGDLMMLIVSELGEAAEARRCNRFCRNDIDVFMEHWEHEKDFNALSYAHYIRGTFEEEIADTIIRLADLCGYLGIDIERHITAKMKYNETRPYKHGKDY